jgi:hypothetical protein
MTENEREIMTECVKLLKDHEKCDKCQHMLN